MPTSTVFTLIRQLVTKKATNKFPVTYAPDNMHAAAAEIQKGRLKINPPVELPPNFRGKLAYDVDACIGCKICLKVCPSEALVFKPEEKKIKHYVSRCTFCSQCVDVCPKDCLKMSDEFLIAGLDKYGKDMVLNP